MMNRLVPYFFGSVIGIACGFIFHSCHPSWAQLTETSKQEIQLRNELKNSGFENSKANWSNSGATFAIVTNGSNLLQGTASATWDASATSQTLSQTLAVPEYLKGKNCLATLRYKGGDANIDFKVTDGSNTLASTTLAAATDVQTSHLTFVCPSSGNVVFQLASTANAAIIALDHNYLGANYLLTNISQAQLVGSSYIATTASCQWSRTNTAMGAFGNDTDCPGPTIEVQKLGSWQTTDADQPAQTINNLPPGIYIVEMSVASFASTGGPNMALAVSDGTTTTGHAVAPSSATVIANTTVIAYFEYATAGNRTFTLHGSSSANAIQVDAAAGNNRVWWKIYRFPSSTEIAYLPDVASWRVNANISGGNIDLGTSDQTSYITPNNSSLTLTAVTGSAPVGISCSSTNDNSVGSTTCSSGNEEPGIVVDLPRAGAVEVCFAFTHTASTSTSGQAFPTFQVVHTANGSQTISLEGGARVSSGTTTAGNSIFSPHRLCGVFNHTSNGKKTYRLMYEQDITATVTVNDIKADAGASAGQRDVQVTARYIDQQTPMPLLVNSVQSTSTGITRIEAANLNCDSGSTITSQHGSWVSSIGNISSGACAITLVSGTFSSAPYCTASDNRLAVKPLILAANSGSATTVTVDCANNADADCSSVDFNLVCMGAR